MFGCRWGGEDFARPDDVDVLRLLPGADIQIRLSGTQQRPAGGVQRRSLLVGRRVGLGNARLAASGGMCKITSHASA
jgi:hypothetical protein